MLFTGSQITRLYAYWDVEMELRLLQLLIRGRSITPRLFLTD